MEKALADLLSKQEITEVVYRTARGSDRQDVAIASACYHEDGTDYHGLANGPISNLMAVLGRSKLLMTQHAISNVLIELDGDVAQCESCFSAIHQSRDADGNVRDEMIRGRYLDRFERRGSGPWKIARRVVLWDWSRVERPGETWFDMIRRERPDADDRFIFGRRDKQDMLYTNALPAELEA